MLVYGRIFFLKMQTRLNLIRLALSWNFNLYIL